MIKSKQKLKIVSIGGGSGGFVVDRGLSKYDVELTSITTSFDNGGSAGKLRDEFGTLPQGDVRRRILAQAESDTTILRDLFSFRFKSEGSLDDHSLGNLILTASSSLWGIQNGIDNIAKLFDVRGRILPITYDSKSHLCAELSDGTILKGETHIDLRDKNDSRTIKRVFLSEKAFITSLAKGAILKADYIIFCPGDIYTSIVPNFLVNGFSECLKNSNAKIIYICNIMTKKSETANYKLSDFKNTLEKYSNRKLDAIVYNSKKIPKNILNDYKRKEFSDVVVNDLDDNMVKNLEVLSNTGLKNDVIRHSSNRLAYELMKLINKKILVWDLDDTILKTTKTITKNKKGTLNLKNIEIYNNVKEILEDNSFLHILLSHEKDGEGVQFNKLSKLNLKKYFEEIFIVKEGEGKNKILKSLKERFVLNENNIFVIGDNTESELMYASRLGLKTIRVKIDGKRRKDKTLYKVDLTIEKEEDFLKLKLL